MRIPSASAYLCGLFAQLLLISFFFCASAGVSIGLLDFISSY